MSQLATSWQPAAVARPPTSATTGFGSAQDRLHHARAAAEHVLEIGAPAIGVAAVRRHLLQVVAAGKELPLSAMTTTRTDASSAGLVERRLQRVEHRLGERVRRRVGERQAQHAGARPLDCGAARRRFGFGACGRPRSFVTFRRAI